MAETQNGNDGATASGAETADIHGQAAMLLVESLIHGLIARSVLSVQDAIEIVDDAAAVREETGIETGEEPSHVARSLLVLRSISASLASDLEDRPVQST